MEEIVPDTEMLVAQTFWVKLNAINKTAVIAESRVGFFMVIFIVAGYRLQVES